MFPLLPRLVKTDDRDALARELAWLFGFVRPHRLAVTGLLVLSACATGLTVAQPWLTKLLIDRGLMGRDSRMLIVIAAAMVVASLCSAMLAGANRYMHTRLSGRVLFALRSAVYAHLQRLSPAFYGGRRTGDLLSRLDGDVAELQRFALDALFAAVSALIGLIATLSLLLALSWQLASIALVLVPFEVLWMRTMRRKVERDARAVRECAADVSSFFVETLPAMKFIQASGRQSAERDHLNTLGDHYMARLLRLQVTEFLTQSVPGALTTVSRAAVFVIGGMWVIQGRWPLGSLIAFTSYLGMAIGPVKSLLGLFVSLQRMTVSLGRVMELRQVPVDVEDPDGDAQSVPRYGDLVFDGVWFAHDAREQPVLRGVDACWPAGSTVGIRGVSGSGKSTLIDLLQRFYDPDAGAIRLGGVDLRRLRLADLRRHVAVVSQDIVLFRGSLADNLRYAAPGATRDDILRAAHAAQLDTLLDALPGGIDGFVGERGQQLSGGQRQRIAIARALLQDPSILVLDEATSGIDPAMEHDVIAQIHSLFPDRMRVFISHRASTLDGVQIRVELAQGRLVACAPKELLREV